jgi:hypothetical protein
MRSANHFIGTALTAMLLPYALLTGDSTVLVAAPTEPPSVDNGKSTKDRAPQIPSPKQIVEITRMEVATWQLELHLDMPKLDPQAVQYAIFDEDPASEYKAQIKRMQKPNRQQLENADTQLWKEQVRNVQMKVDWDNGFKNVTGENITLLTNRPGARSSGIVVSSNGPSGKKWVVTKTVDIDGRPYCWSIPVEVKIGKHVFVKLGENNTFDLQSPYDTAMKEPQLSGGKKESKK